MMFKKDYSRKVVTNKSALDYVSFIKQDLLKYFESDFCSLLLPFDNDVVRDVSVLVREKKGFDYLVVVGIGGSNLGTLAIVEALFGKNHLLSSKKKVFFVDTVDSDSLADVLSFVKGKKFLLVLISKSGTTTESIANFEVLLKQIPLSQRKSRVVTISDEGSLLSSLALRKGYSHLFIPKKVGGRFSVFSSVGLFPLAFLGVDIKKLLLGARGALEKFNKNNYALEGALDLYHNYLSGKKINDLFIFSNDLESLGKWYRQLMGESVGKRFSLSGSEKFIGITPTVSIGSTDLHSVGQLYLGGPRDKFTSFVSVKNHKSIVVPSNKDIILRDLQGLSFKKIMDSILLGTMRAYKKNKLPFNHYEFVCKDEFELGFFMQTKMFEIMILAHLLGVNPFDQPSVEEYKSETRKLLKK